MYVCEVEMCAQGDGESKTITDVSFCVCVYLFIRPCSGYFHRTQQAVIGGGGGGVPYTLVATECGFLCISFTLCL